MRNHTLWHRKGIACSFSKKNGEYGLCFLKPVEQVISLQAIRFSAALLAIMFLLGQSVFVVAASDETAVHMQELAKIAEQGHYRFMQMQSGGYDAGVAKDLLEKDRMVLESEPTGTVKIIVKDSQSGDLIEGAQVILTTKRSRFSTVDGVKTQTANPFLAIDLGKTGKDGSALYASPVYGRYPGRFAWRVRNGKGDSENCRK